jgi:hypothetical protein
VEDREARQNGVNSVHSSVRLGKVDKPTMETSREGLERKAKIYEQLRKGKSGGLSEKQLETALIDVSSLDNWMGNWILGRCERWRSTY